MNGEEYIAQDACGCCEGVSVEAPIVIDNRPGLSAVAYRIGVHSEVLASLHARLSSRDFPALAQLRTRDSDDFSLALLDAYSCMADVLSFYQERLANESYLRTATERLSVSEMARLIGYRLKPGVAAETYLAFTLQEPPSLPVSNDPPQTYGIPEKITLDIGVKVQSVPEQDEKPQIFETVESIEARPEWNALKPQTSHRVVPVIGTDTIYLKGTANRLSPGDTLLFVGPEREKNIGNENWDFRRITAVETDGNADYTKVILERGLGTHQPYVPPSVDPKVYALRQRASLFGYNAPDWRVMSNSVKRSYAGSNASDTVINGPEWPKFKIADISGQSNASSIDTIYLDALYSGVVHGSWLVLSIPEYQELYQVDTVSEDARALFTLTGKTTRLTLKGENLKEKYNEKVRETAIFAQSELLEYADAPINTPINGDTIILAEKIETLTEGRKLIVSGETLDGILSSEVITLKSADEYGDTTALHFITGLHNQYKRETVTIYANVALATHGETVRQTLGSGAAHSSHQRFILKHAPLTYIGAPNESGASAALEVRVNDILWHETSTQYGAGPNDRSYILRTDEDGVGTLQFGDGKRGARLPTGQENVRAVYRKGIGSVGNVKAGHLSQLLSRPLGLKAVSNLMDATGGADADSTEHARRNIPLGVRTLGRAVSLRDYEDYARAYTGIAKAQARLLTTRAGRTVFITVAADDGVQPAQPTLTKLLSSLRQSGDPLVHCEAKAYRKATFRVGLRIKCQADYEPGTVLADVEAALRSTFSFASRDFGQTVFRSEIIATAQRVNGVAGVDLDCFYRGPVAGLEERLTPANAEVDSSGMAVSAELLLLDDGPLDLLEEMS